MKCLSVCTVENLMNTLNGPMCQGGFLAGQIAVHKVAAVKLSTKLEHAELSLLSHRKH